MPISNRAHEARLVAERLTYALPDGRALLHDLSLSLGCERTGLVGPNGSGKTTLLQLFAGALAPSSGHVHRNAVVAVLPQDFRPPPDAPLTTVLGVHDRLAALGRLDRGSGTPNDLELVGDDWSLPDRAAAVLARFGLGHLSLDRPVGAVSGGEATRVALAGLALGQPDFLLLDEPTNHLDTASRRALYEFVQEWTSGLLCVSHDRALLRRMDRIVELSALGVRVYGGNYDAYRESRDAADQAAVQELQSARASLRASERKAREVRERLAWREAQGNRNRAKSGIPKILLNTRRTQARASGGRVRAVAEREVDERSERADRARQQMEERERPRFDIASSGLHAGRTVLQLHNVTVQYPGSARPVLDAVSLEIVGPERVALVGPNGSGKTTLLEVAMGTLMPHAGTVHRLPSSEVAFLDQLGSALRPELSVLENFQRFHPLMNPTATRSSLARFLFGHEAALQSVETLSGGQRLRASLACILGGPRPPLLLVLDEPTNHLDLDAMEAMESALLGSDGALLVVSHDAEFLEAIGVTRWVEL